MVDVQTVSIVVASASVVVGIIYYSLQIRMHTRATQTDLIIRLYSLASGREFLEAWETLRNREIGSHSDYKKRYGSFTEVSQVNTVLGELGMLLQRKLIDVDLVYDLTGGMAIVAYEKLRPLNEDVKKMRGLESDSFDYLYSELKRREQRKAS
jgi:hypothetical protein